MTKAYLMTPEQAAKRLMEKYGEGGMSAAQVYAEFGVRKERLPAGLEYWVKPGGKRRRYAPGSVARYYLQGRRPELPGFGEDN
jgi:hypothetical protein